MRFNFIKVKEFIYKHRYSISVFAISLIIGLFWCLLKTSFHSDESLTFALANKKGGWIYYDDAYGWFDKSFWQGYSAHDYFYDWHSIYWNQYFDCHPPLFYMILHSISAIFPNRLSIWFAFIINISSFVINALLIYRLASLITKNKRTALIIAILYTLNSAIVTGLVFIRMYQLVSSFIMIFTLCAYHIIFDYKNKIIYYLILTLSMIGGGLTHYYFYLDWTLKSRHISLKSRHDILFATNLQRVLDIVLE